MDYLDIGCTYRLMAAGRRSLTRSCPQILSLIFTTRNSGGSCWWQEGGPFIPGTVNTFGGNSKTEFGPLEPVHYPTAPFGTVTIRLNDFRRMLPTNPCKTG